MAAEGFPRPLTSREADALDYLLAEDDPDIAVLREQRPRVLVARRWECCPSIDVLVDGREAPPGDGDRVVIGARSMAIGDPPQFFDLLLFERGGQLRTLELVHGGDAPGEFPPVSVFDPALGSRDIRLGRAMTATAEPSQVVRRFAELAAEQGKATAVGDSARANTAHDQLWDAWQHLVAAHAPSAVLALYDDPDAAVRTWAARMGLSVDPVGASAVLAEVGSGDYGIHSLVAEMTLSEYRAGNLRFKLDHQPRSRDIE